MPSGSLRQKLMVLIAGKTLLFLAICFAMQESERARTLQLIETLQTEKSATISNLIKLKEGPKRQFLIDNTNWDELYDIALKPSPGWLKANLGTLASRADFEAMWLVNRDGRTIDHWSLKQNSFSDELPVKFDSILHARMDTAGTASGFVKVGNRLLRVGYAKTFKSDDDSRTGPFTGYLVAADDWTVEDFAALSGLTQTSSAQRIMEPRAFRSSRFDDMGNFEVAMPLNGFDDRPVAQAIFRGRNEAVYQNIEATAKNTLLFITLLIAIIVSTIGVVLKRVQRPLFKIARAIAEERPELVMKIARGTDEVARVALLTTEFYAQRQQLQSINESLEQRVLERTQELEQAYDAVILGWSRAMDSKDKETEGHTQRVAEMSVYIGNQLGLDNETLVWLYRGALLHDIGKIGVPDAVLLKAGKLTDEEMAVIKEHPVLAYEMLKPIKFLEPCLSVPRYHHEKWDGTGYPDGLAGEEIPLLARIFAVADVWDALRSDRPYRKSWSESHTREYIAEQSGTHFDPEVVKAFLRAAPLTHPSDVYWNQEGDAAA